MHRYGERAETTTPMALSIKSRSKPKKITLSEASPIRASTEQRQIASPGVPAARQQRVLHSQLPVQPGAVARSALISVHKRASPCRLLRLLWKGCMKSRNLPLFQIFDFNLCHTAVVVYGAQKSVRLLNTSALIKRQAFRTSTVPYYILYSLCLLSGEKSNRNAFCT